MFSRWTRHLVSIVPLTCLFLVLVSLGHELRASAQSPRQQQGSQANDARAIGDTPITTLPGRTLNAKATNSESEADENEWLKPGPLTSLALVVVAIWAARIAIDNLEVIKEQSAETARAAKAAEDNIATQERHFRLVNQQWLDARYAARVIDWDGVPSIDLSMDVVNDTAMSVTVLEAIHVIVSVNPMGVLGEPFQFVNNNAVLGPRGRAFTLQVGSYRIDTDEKRILYNAAGLSLSISTFLSYRDAFSQPRTQGFGAYVRVLNGTVPVITPLPGGLDHHPGEAPIGHPDTTEGRRTVWGYEIKRNNEGQES